MFRGFPVVSETPKFWLAIGTTADHHLAVYKSSDYLVFGCINTLHAG